MARLLQWLSPGGVSGLPALCRRAAEGLPRQAATLDRAVRAQASLESIITGPTTTHSMIPNV